MLIDGDFKKSLRMGQVKRFSFENMGKKCLVFINEEAIRNIRKKLKLDAKDGGTVSNFEINLRI